MNFTTQQEELFKSIPVLTGITIKYKPFNKNNLFEVIKEIATGNIFRTKIEEVRSIQDKNKRQDFKRKNLPFFTIGEFKNNERQKKALIKTQFAIFDLDHIAEWKSKWEQIVADKSVFAAFRSPSGDGIKIIYKFDKPITDPQLYSSVYKFYASKFNIDLGQEPDMTSDCSRACYISYDPKIYVNETPALLSVVENIKPVIKQTSNSSEVDTTYVPKAVEFLSTKIKNYNDWVTCGFALTSLGEGRQYFHRLSQNPNYNDTPEEVDEKFDELVESSRGEVTIASLFEIAIRHGFVYPTINIIDINAKPLSAQMMEWFDEDRKRLPGTLIGHPLSTFKKIAEYTDGIQPGFYIVAAEANVGKTAFITNLCLDLLDTNPDIQVIYFSLDDSKRSTINRLLSIKTHCSINSLRRKIDDKSLAATVEQGRSELIELAQKDRIQFYDLGDVTKIEEVESIISNNKHPQKVVFIDGVYNLQVESSEGIRVENIKRAQTIKEIVDKNKLPLIATGELRKKSKDDSKDKKPTLHDLNETGKYSYNANVVWLLSFKNADKNEKSIIVELEFAKNKLSDFKGSIDLNFIREKGIIKEATLNLPSYPNSFDTEGEDL
ncbi:MAG: PriCT-2 domain-containing protein [Melioribacteraceae bacterium]|nr:PriCT-2 domain-containing protein [Melioribacteraceae bacterium]